MRKETFLSLPVWFYIVSQKETDFKFFSSDEPNDGINKMLIENWDKNLLDIASKID